jgi:hypothetical protein
MNERIRECWLKAAREDSDPDNWDTQEQFIERFAELIVRECVEQIQICSEQIKNDDGYADDNIWPIMQSIVDAVAIDVKEHFGVES